MLNDELKQLAEKSSYIHPSRYISGRIVEYDIKSANITMLYKYGKIDLDYYNYLSSLPKFNREKDIGLLIRSDISFFNTIRDGIIEAKKKLFEANNVKISEIVRIANDAVYINKSYNLQYLIFDDVEFRPKSISSVMLRLDKLIIFVWENENGLNVDVKGLGENVQLLHAEYLLYSIAYTVYLVEKVSLNDALKYITDLYNDYINLRLPKEYYRELTPQSLYHYKYSDFYLTDIKNLEDIDINYNLYLIRELWSILLEKYNIMIKRK